MASRNARPVVDPLNPEFTRVVARPRGGAPIPQPKDSGLIEGLAQLNPALSRYTQQAAAIQAAEDEYQGALAEKRGRVAGQGEDLGGVDRTNVEPSMTPNDLPADFSGRYVQGFRKAVAKRLATQSATDLWNTYLSQRESESFNADAFLASTRAEHLNGIGDTDVLDAMTEAHNNIAQNIREDQIKLVQQRQQALATSTASALLNDGLRSEMTAEELFTEYTTNVAPTILGMGRHNRTEVAKMFIDHIAGLSTKMGGAPELFDALTNFKDADGFTVSDRSGGLGSQVAAARKQAEAQRQQINEQARESDRTQLWFHLEDKLKSNPAALTDDYLLQLAHGPGSLLKGHEVIELRRARDKSMGDIHALDQAMRDAATGNLAAHDNKTQKDVINQLTAGHVRSLVDTINAVSQVKPEQREEAARQSSAQIAKAIALVHSRAGASVPSEPLKNYFESLGKVMPEKGAEPSAQFLTLASVFREMDDTTKRAYTNEETYDLLSNYWQARVAGEGTSSAYSGAYRSVSPEAKAAAEARLKDPEVQSQISKVMRSGPEGAGWGWLWGAGWLNLRPSNDAELTSAAKQEYVRYLRRNPAASEKDAKSYLEGWAKNNFVLDRDSGTAIRLPQIEEFRGETSRLAITDYLAAKKSELRLGELAGGDWSLSMQLMDPAKGTYMVIPTRDGAPQEGWMETVNLRDLLRNYRNSTLFTDEDRATLADVQKRAADGTLSVEEAKGLSPLIEKARRNDLLGGETIRRLQKIQDDAFNKRISEIPPMSLGTPSDSNILDTRRPRIDHTATAQVAESFLGMQGHKGLALALTTMGESMVLKAYADPAAGAGSNIAMGYNLKANEKTVHSDLKRAGVPEDRIADVVAGRSEITKEQAMRLTILAMDRYEKLAKDAAEGFTPGLWSKMTPQQRAVMMDIAWQTGNPAQFKKAMTALLNGDEASFREETKVFFTNRAGQRVEDTRRNNLRAHMLAGTFLQNVVGTALRTHQPLTVASN